MNRLVAKIPERYQLEGIKWLILEEDAHGTKGIFIFSHVSLDDDSVYDNWYEDVEKARHDALSHWGIKESDWKPLD